MARKVLLADDSVTAQNMGRRILVDAGYEVITVNNGSSALKKVAEAKPDLIVLDVYMPGYGGLEVCQRIRESQETARIPVLLTVGKLEPFKSEEARRVRADAFIVKPFEASELLTALTKLEDKIVPQASGRKSSRAGKSFADEEPGASREFGDPEKGWKNRLKIPPPHHPKEVKEEEVVEAVAPKIEKSPSRPEPETVELPVPAEEKTEPASVEPAIKREETAIAPEPVAEIAAAKVSEMRTRSEAPKHEDEVAAALESLAPANGDESHGALEPEPVTMAVAAAHHEYSGPRWIAQEVAVTDDESAMILEQEMRKAFAAFAAADAARMSVSAPFAEASSSTIVEAETPAVATIAESAFEPASFAPVGESQSPEVSSEPGTRESSSVAVNADEEAKETVAYAAAASAGGSAVSTTITEAAPAKSEISAEVATPGEASHDSELAAAWASWRQVRDSVSTPEFTSQVADAAATGFKEIRHEEPATKSEDEAAADSGEQSGAIASIVDSVLAELKPKLMREIAKKIKK